MLQFFSDQKYTKVWVMVTGNGLPMNYYPTMWSVFQQRNGSVKIICKFTNLELVVVQRENSQSQWVLQGKKKRELAYLLRQKCQGKQVRFELDE